MTFNVAVENGQIWKRHIEQIKSLETRKPRNEFENKEYSDFGIDSTIPSTVTDTPEPDVTQNPSLQPQPPSVTERYPQRHRHPPDRYTS